MGRVKREGYWFEIVTPVGEVYTVVRGRRTMKARGDVTAPGDTGLPDQHERIVRIRRGLEGEELVEVLIHELLHVADWSKDEGWVHSTALFLARALDEAGLIDHDADAGA